jgi:hypothetical protein
MDDIARASLQIGLRRLIAIEASSVVFVRDYVQLHFDPIAGSRWTYPLLTMFTWPVVHDRTSYGRKGDPGYRDALCDRIGVSVAGAAVTDEEAQLWFTDGACLTISLRAAVRAGEESLLFTDGSDAWWVV